MRHAGPRTASGLAARHVRELAELAPSALTPSPATQPPTLTLVLSRRARRAAAEAAEAAAIADPRLAVIERVSTALQLAGNVAALALSALAWAWIGTHRSSAAGADGVAVPPGRGMLPSPAGATTETALVLVMLLVCLLMAPSVNPFYVPPPERRVLHTGQTAVFAVLALSTVAMIAGAAR